MNQAAIDVKKQQLIEALMVADHLLQQQPYSLWFLRILRLRVWPQDLWRICCMPSDEVI